jgi:hypothetical protein
VQIADEMPDRFGEAAGLHGTILRYARSEPGRKISSA